MTTSRLIIFRTDAGPSVGIGHLTRCIALAEAFAERGYACRFVGSAPEFLSGSIPGGRPLFSAGPAHDWTNDEFHDLVGEAELLVTDHYGIGADWQSSSPTPVLAITDPPLKPQHCALLLLPAVFDADKRDALSAPAHCLLRSAIVAARKKPKRGKRLLVSCGGGEDRGLTLRILDALVSDDDLKMLQVTIVTPDTAMDSTRLAECAALLGRVQLVSKVVNMASLIAGHDIAVGAPGGSALERACLGLAQVLVPIAENQEGLGVALASRECATVLPRHADSQAIAEALRVLVSDQVLRHCMSRNAFELIDGNGASRVVDEVEQRVFQK